MKRTAENSPAFECNVPKFITLVRDLGLGLAPHDLDLLRYFHVVCYRGLGLAPHLLG